MILRDPFLTPTDEPNVLDTVDPAWGLGSADPDYPPRAAYRALLAEGAAELEAAAVATEATE